MTIINLPTNVSVEIDLNLNCFLVYFEEWSEEEFEQWCANNNIGSNKNGVAKVIRHIYVKLNNDNIQFEGPQVELELYDACIREFEESTLDCIQGGNGDKGVMCKYLSIRNKGYIYVKAYKYYYEG